MINGKFFSGLTDKMMNRGGSGPDRQRTNMYWPDEEDSVPANEYSHTPTSRQRTPSTRTSSSRNSSIGYDSQSENDVNTKELVKKQQESKIKFYDYDKDYVAPSRTITPSSVGKNLPHTQDQTDNKVNRKLQTLSSRIEFYDFAEDKRNKPSGSSRQSLSSPQGPTHTPAVEIAKPANNQQTRVVNHEIKVEHEDGVKSRGLKKQISSSVIDLSQLDLSDFEIEELKRLKRPSKDEIDRKLSSFNSNLQAQKQQQKTVNGTTESRRPETRTITARNTPNGNDMADAPNEARRNAHRHLKSNIFMCDDVQPPNNKQSTDSQRRAYSIRDTAVCRVGVGLPDL